MDNSKSFIIGMVALVVVFVIVITIAMLKAYHQDGDLKPRYDERQTAIRGRGYMYAFYSTLIIFCLIPFVTTEEQRDFLDYMLYFIPCLIGVLIHICYCILHDAYIEMNLKKKQWMSGMFAISLVNLFFGFTAIWSDELVKDGKLQSRFLNLFVGIMCIFILISLIIKGFMDKGGAADEES